jgi:hypothetical protein
MPDGIDLLLFSRGRGRGHATPDLWIVRELRKLIPTLQVSFASYGTGAQALVEAGERVVDLGLPEANPFLGTAVQGGLLIREASPLLVVSHEEFGVVPAAKILGVPVVFITHWFTHPEHLSMQALKYADEVLFIDRPGVFAEPEYLRDRIRYVGPVLRVFDYQPTDRHRARAELGIQPDEVLVLMLSSGWFTEERAPSMDLVLEAFGLVNHAAKRLIWVAGSDLEEVSRRTLGIRDVSVIRSEPVIEKLMVACDVAVTKGTHNIGNELAALGIRSISLSYGSNFADDEFARSISSNTFLWAEETSSATLAGHIEASLRYGPARPNLSLLNGKGAAATANYLASRLKGRSA